MTEFALIWLIFAGAGLALHIPLIEDDSTVGDAIISLVAGPLAPLPPLVLWLFIWLARNGILGKVICKKRDD